jgi:hypothetical protein
VDLVSFKEIGQRLGVHRMSVRRIVDRVAPQLGIEVQKARGNKTNANWGHYLTRDDADRLVAYYKRHIGPGRTREDEGGGDDPVKSQVFGVFYLIQLVPEAIPNRIKIGYTDSLPKRLVEHQTSAPTARVIASWPCKRSWDYAAMDSLTREGCTWLLNEVFEGDPDGFIARGNAFFALMPASETTRELAEHSPLRIQGGTVV